MKFFVLFVNLMNEKKNGRIECQFPKIPKINNVVSGSIIRIFNITRTHVHTYIIINRYITTTYIHNYYIPYVRTYVTYACMSCHVCSHMYMDAF
jgi:hypothetical protein